MPRGRRGGRGRHGGGRGRSGGATGNVVTWDSPDAWYLYRKILELYYMGLSVDEIVHFLETGRLPPKEPGPDRPPTPEEPSKPKLEVKGVDLKVLDNAKAHHTHEYDLVKVESTLVVRRGQAFTIRLDLSRALEAQEIVRLIFEMGTEPTESKDSRAALLVSKEPGQQGKWGAQLLKKSGASLEVGVSTPPDCLVGKWKLRVNLKKKGNPKPVFSHVLDKPVYVLFNPWCRDDAVYNADEDELEEYIMADTGCIYVGNSRYSRGRSWNFGQFSGKVLDSSIYLLDSSELKMQLRGDPVWVSRKLSGRINSLDDDGVLQGNWSGDYSGGKKPTDWGGSVKILEEFYRTKQPVKYGQCWVFSGVLTTACRALGIPCRSVTNFASAHDTDGSVTIDVHLDVNGHPIKFLNDDSIWNFHVWNEAWMRREDLEHGYGGWQAVDATPQESSEGAFQCGPCPVRAIKEGNITVAYDGPFIFAEVNSDEVSWTYDDETDQYTPKKVDKTKVGKNMSTRALKKNRFTPTTREVVTDLYKHPEGSEEERAAMYRAYTTSRHRGYKTPYDIQPPDVKVLVEFDDETKMGSEAVIKLRFTSDKRRSLSGSCHLYAMYYTGLLGDEILQHDFNDVKVVPGKEGTVVKVSVAPEVYLDKLVEGCGLYLTLMGLVAETKQHVIENEKLGLSKPNLTITSSDKPRIGRRFTVNVSFTNPLPKTLTGCTLTVEGQSVMESGDFAKGEVMAKGTFSESVTLTPKAGSQGERTVVFIFNSNELYDIDGEYTFTVSA